MSKACGACGVAYERPGVLGAGDPADERCPECASAVRRRESAPALAGLDLPADDLDLDGAPTLRRIARAPEDAAVAMPGPTNRPPPPRSATYRPLPPPPAGTTAPPPRPTTRRPPPLPATPFLLSRTTRPPAPRTGGAPLPTGAPPVRRIDAPNTLPSIRAAAPGGDALFGIDVAAAMRAPAVPRFDAFGTTSVSMSAPGERAIDPSSLVDGTMVDPSLLAPPPVQLLGAPPLDPPPPRQPTSPGLARDLAPARRGSGGWVATTVFLGALAAAGWTLVWRLQGEAPAQRAPATVATIAAESTLPASTPRPAHAALAPTAEPPTASAPPIAPAMAATNAGTAAATRIAQAPAAARATTPDVASRSAAPRAEDEAASRANGMTDAEFARAWAPLGGAAARPAAEPEPAAPAPETEPERPFDREAARAALEPAVASAASCRKSPGDPTGVARVAITFAPSGRVTTAVVDGPPFVGTAVGGCVASRMRGVEVPPFTGQPVTVRRSVPLD